jgi:hypothetical protein
VNRQRPRLTIIVILLFEAIGTGLVRHLSSSKIMNTVAKYALQASAVAGIGAYKSSNAGAATSVVAALDPALAEMKGM